MNVLELSGVTRAHGPGRPALDAVDLTVAAGDVVGLLGPNGAGKTTLLKVALGMLHPQQGTVRLFGVDPAREPIRSRSRVGYVSEDQVLPPYLRVAEVLQLHAALFERWDDRTARHLLERFELDPRRTIDALSKGEARRVAVVCAIAHRPELLLLDEPAGGFDPAARRELLEATLQFLASEGSTIVFSSHHMADVERLAQRVVVLQQGHKVIDRELDALREGTALVTLAVDGGVRAEEVRALEGCLGARVREGELRALFDADVEAAARRVATLAGGGAPRVARLGLEDLFIELVEGRARRA